MAILKSSLSQNQGQTSPKREDRRFEGDDFDDGETQAGPVLLLTIHDAIYPINTHLIERICSYCGPVLRIVIFRKKCVQAMVEMDSILAAQRVKAAINGCDIYKHCCTVKVEYAKPTCLNVFKNDDNTRDFTKENRHFEGKFRDSSPTPFLPGPVMDEKFDKYGFRIQSNNDHSTAPRSFNEDDCRNRIMMYDLPEVLNADRIFNYMCLYGNVRRVQFFSKPSFACLVEYETEKQAKEAVSFVNNVRFFGAKVNVEQTSIEFSRRAEFNLRDESPNFADFTQNRNNRFLTDEAASKNRLSKAVKSLHFYNAPSSITIEELSHISAGFQINPPTRLKPFKKTQDKVMQMKSFPFKFYEPRVAGLLEYKTVGDAVAAICCLNHFVMKSSKKNPFTLKLCFATN